MQSPGARFGYTPQTRTEIEIDDDRDVIAVACDVLVAASDPPLVGADLHRSHLRQQILMQEHEVDVERLGRSAPMEVGGACLGAVLLPEVVVVDAAVPQRVQVGEQRPEDTSAGILDPARGRR